MNGGGLSMAAVVNAKVMARNKRWGSLMPRRNLALQDAGLPGYKSMFAAPPGQGPLEKALAGVSVCACARVLCACLRL